MRKIAIFTLGEGLAARRVISLFNEGNRIRVAVVVAESEEEAARFRDFDASIAVFTTDDWKNSREKVLAALEECGVEKIALEGISREEVVAEEETLLDDIESFSISTEEEAPREVVAAFKEKVRNDLENIPAGNRSVDEEWARTLKVDFDEETARQVPPPIPGGNHSQAAPASEGGNRGYSARTTPGNPYAGLASQTPSQLPDREEMPKSYLVWAIVVTILCCLVPGVVAIIFASQVSSKYYSGDIEGAKRASRNAEIWIIVSFVLGVLSATLYLPIALIN